MSIADKITALTTARAGIAEAIAAKGVTVPSGSGFSSFQGLIESIQSSGSGMPDGVANVGYGTFTLASDISHEASFTFSHGMGVRPDFVLIWTEAETTADNKGHILGAAINTLTPPFHTFDWGSTATSAYKESSITGWSRNSSSGALNNYSATQAYSTRWALDAENVTIGAMSVNYYWPAGIEYKWIGVKLA